MVSLMLSLPCEVRLWEVTLSSTATPKFPNSTVSLIFEAFSKYVYEMAGIFTVVAVLRWSSLPENASTATYSTIISASSVRRTPSVSSSGSSNHVGHVGLNIIPALEKRCAGCSGSTFERVPLENRS